MSATVTGLALLVELQGLTRNAAYSVYLIASNGIGCRKRENRVTRRTTGGGDRSTEGSGHTALVTGASSGIGRSFALQLASRGYDVVLVARRTDRLDALSDCLTSRANVRAHVVTADLGQPDVSRNIKAELDRLGITVDFL